MEIFVVESVDGRTEDGLTTIRLAFGSGELKKVYPCTPYFHFLNVELKGVFITGMFS